MRARDADGDGAFAAADQNDIDTLVRIAKEDKHASMAKDRNDWQPIHEATRGGLKDTIELLVHSGADINARGPIRALA